MAKKPPYRAALITSGTADGSFSSSGGDLHSRMIHNLFSSETLRSGLLFRRLHKRGEVFIVPAAGRLGMIDPVEEAGRDLAFTKVFGNARRTALIVVYRVVWAFCIGTGTE